MYEEVQRFESRFATQSIAVGKQRISAETDQRFYGVRVSG
jgi:hypothetical protein